MPTAPFDAEALSQALSDDAPSGPDLEYDPAYAALELAGAGKPEVVYGDKTYPAEPPDWPAVFEQSQALAKRTRDLRVAVWLLRASTRLHGLAGAAAGLQLISRLLARLWDSVYPQLDASEGNDPTMRLNALAALYFPDAVLADLRAATLVGVRGAMRVRDLELGLGRAVPASDESAPTEAGVTQGLAGLLQDHPDLQDTAQLALQAGQAISATIEAHLGVAQTPDASPLLALLQMVAGAIASLTGGPAPAGDGTGGTTAVAGGPARGAAAGAIASRADAVRELERVCEWIERNEPTNPAPLLIRRAQRLMNKSFMEIMRDLAPDGVSQIENLAGPDAQH